MYNCWVVSQEVGEFKYVGGVFQFQVLCDQAQFQGQCESQDGYREGGKFHVDGHGYFWDGCRVDIVRDEESGENATNQEAFNGVNQKGVVFVNCGQREEAGLSQECEEDNSGAVDSCEGCGDEGYQQGSGVGVRCVGSFDDEVFGVKACKEGYAGECEAADNQGCGGEGYCIKQSAYFSDVLLVIQAVDNGSRTYEQYGFEECVGADVKKCQIGLINTDGYDY